MLHENVRYSLKFSLFNDNYILENIQILYEYDKDYYDLYLILIYKVVIEK